MHYEKVYNRVLKQQGKIPSHMSMQDVEKYARIFFEAGVKAALGISTQQPVLLERKPK